MTSAAVSTFGRSILIGRDLRGQIVGVDLVEVSPPYDPSGATSMLAAQLLLTLLGYIFVAA
ncbi:MAG: hypothetical protein CL569_06775 [Alphaproteobacteria bacterium]|nr:hypothetical protein [Alphaproteobacteria bacterium]